ncbi:MAG TPA: hypothetical protein VKA00_07640 [Trueperaceae bacterium]|nr:hypothetical protein [Trueperaceae bacterium]
MYAYLLSTLPGFGPEDVPPLSAAELLERCRGFVPNRALTALADPEAAANGSGHAAETARRWLDGERQIANAVARRRAPFWGSSPMGQAREHEGFRVLIEEGVARAYEAPDPLARQRALDALRWRLLDELAGPVPWGFPALLAYAQRLRIAREWAARDPSTGREALGRTLDAVEARHDQEHAHEETHG